MANDRNKTEINLPPARNASQVIINVPTPEVSLTYREYTFEVSSTGVDVVDEDGTYVLTDATLVEAVEFVENEGANA